MTHDDRSRIAPQARREDRTTRALQILIAVMVSAALVGGGSLVQHLRTTSWHSVPAAPAPADSALKGFLPFAPEPGRSASFPSSALPYSMEWFYLPVDAVVTGKDTYDWAVLDSWLTSIASRGHQAVFRLYLDYPGRESGVPDHLIADGIDTSRRYTEYGNTTSFSPNYDDPRIRSMMVNLITALGERYDGDPRIGYITQGLVGFWGEGHTYPQDGWKLPVSWLANRDTQVQLLDAWEAAFDVTPTMVRYPDNMNAHYDFGYHDDSFGWATLPTADWHFLSKMSTAGVLDTWQTAPIGGEVYPELQSCVFDDPQNCPGQEGHEAAGRGYDMAAAITEAHPSWLVNQQAYAPGYEGAERQRALASHSSLGYNFRVTQVGTSPEFMGGRTIKVRVTNDGEAPFYYDWPVELALLDSSGRPVTSSSADLDLAKLLPGQERTLSALLSTRGLADGSYRLAIRVHNPLAGGTPVRFANEGQSAEADGWLTLGPYTT